MSEPIIRDPGASSVDDSDLAEPTSYPVETTPPSTVSQAAPAVPPGYEILCDLAEGGMGVVYRARDCSLDRPVALKYLLPDYAHDPAAVARFTYEARITGQLQHPGIPPVHQVGTLPDGRPFLAMKLILGRTLADLLAEQGPGAARWLAVFETICQTVAYAHAQDVIHRDLKPQNVMVGAFGEVLVMDWGLAKSLATPERSAPQENQGDPYATAAPVSPSTHLEAGCEATQPGAVLGTPAYMPPEQAIGAVDQLDRRSDVFGLGAILCALLTGKPPFVGADSESTRQLAARAKLADAFERLDGCGAEPDLIALAKRCLSSEQDDRPADAGVLAEEVAKLRHQADERARQAELQAARAQVHADEQRLQAELQAAHARAQAQEQRKRRRLLLTGGGLMVVVLLAGIAGTMVGLVRAESKRKEAEQARDQARRRYQQALETFNDMVFAIQTRLEDRPGTLELRKDLLGNARKGLRKLLEEADRQGNPDSTLVWAYLRMGDVERTLNNSRGALEEYRAGHELAQRLAQADPAGAQAQRDLGASQEKLADVMLETGKTSEALNLYRQSLEVREKLVKADPASAQAQRDLSLSLDGLGSVMLRMGKTPEALDFRQKSLKGRQSLAERPSAQAQRDLAVSLDRLGDVTLAMGKTRQALEFYEQSLKVRQGLDPDGSLALGDLSLSLDKLGGMALSQGRTQNALGHFEKSRQIRQRLADADPRSGQARRDLAASLDRLGDVTLAMGKTRQALEFYEQSLKHRRSLADADPASAQAQGDLSLSLDKLGDVALRQGRTEKALTSQRESLKIRQTLAQADPASAQAQRDLGASQEKLADVMLETGKTSDALKLFEQSLEVREKLARADPASAQAQRDLSLSLDGLGSVMLRMGKNTEALDFYEKYLKLARRLAEADPTSVQDQRVLSIGHERLGNVKRYLTEPKRLEEAWEHYQECVKIRRRLAEADPTNAKAQRDLSVGLERLGVLAPRLETTDKSMEYYRQGLEIREKLARADPTSAQARRDLSVSFEKLGELFEAQGRIADALAYYEESLRLRQRLAADDPIGIQAQTDLFVTYEKLGFVQRFHRHDYAEAIASFAKAHAVLLPWNEKKLLSAYHATRFAYLVQHLDFCKKAEEAVADLSFVYAQKPADVPKLFDARVRVLLHRKQIGDAIKTADCWATWVEENGKSSDLQTQRYLAARGLALCAAASEEKGRLVARLVALLARAEAGGLFDTNVLAHFHKDRDFAGVRGQAAFDEFVGKLKK